MSMLRWMCGVIGKDKTRNTFICEQLDIVSIVDKMRENHLRWYEHMHRRHLDAIVRRCEMINVNGTRRGKERPKKISIETINKDLSTLNLTKHMTFYRSQWWEKIYVADPKQLGLMVLLLLLFVC